MSATTNGSPVLIGGRADAPVLRDPAREYVVAGSPVGYGITSGFLLAGTVDDVVRQFGPRIYDLMDCDDACLAAKSLLIDATLSEGFHLAPTVTAPDGEPPDAETQARLDLQAEVFGSCQRVLDALRSRVDAAWSEALEDGLPHGCATTEQVFELADAGPDAGRQVPTVFRHKPRWAWAFRVNEFMDVKALRCWTTRGWADVERNHFTLFSFRPKGGDPRGRSVYRTAYDQWNAKAQTRPAYVKYLKKFAAPSLVLTAGPTAQSLRVEDPNNPGRTVELSPVDQLLEAGRRYENCSVLALPSGASASVNESKDDGGAFDKAFDRFDRDIFRAVILATRAVLEAQHGSKADSDSSIEVFKLVVGKLRRLICATFRRDWLRRYVELNWGGATADELTPQVSLGSDEQIDPALLTAFANAWDKGLFNPAQKGWLWGRLNAPVPTGWTPEDEEAKEQAARDALAASAAAGAAGAPGAGETPPGGDKPRSGPAKAAPGDAEE